jgi:dTDP-4-amino-4,6-dideoxygalactose transaminase
MTGSISEAEIEAVLDTLRSGWLTMGPRTQAFEAAFAEWAGAEHAVAVGSGAAAVHLALLAAGVSAGDEVVVPALGPAILAAAPAWCGATVVFEDADPVLSQAPEDASFLLAVGLWGRRLPDPLQEQEGLVSDVAGRAVFHSLDEGTPLSVGLGGVVTTDDEDVAARVRTLRGHALTSGTWDRHRGHSAGYDVIDIGFNYRMDEARAALATAKLETVDEELGQRAAVAAHYAQELDTLGAGVAAFADATARDRAAAALATEGIATTLTPLLADRPRASELFERHLQLPLDADPEAVVRCLRRAA